MAGTTNDRPSLRGFRAVATDADPDTRADFRIEIDDVAYHFREVVEQTDTGGYRALEALRLLSVRDRTTGDRLDHPKVGTDELPPELVRALIGATYHFTRPDRPAAPGPQDKRVITDMVRQQNGRWVAILAPGDGVVTSVRGLLRDAARDRLQFTSFRPADGQ